MYLFKLWREIKIWLKVRKVALENKTELAKKGFRIDWIGRIYTVINLPEEVANHSPQVQQTYVLEKLRNFDTIFLKIGIADFIIPEFRVIKNTASYLLVLSPERDYFRFKAFLIFLFKVILGITIIRISFILFSMYWNDMVHYFNKVINFLF